MSAPSAETDAHALTTSIGEHELERYILPEILTHIFSYLPIRDLGHAAQVCRVWRDAADCKSIWRYKEAKIHLKRANPSVFKSLSRRGIRRIHILSLRRSLKEVIRGVEDLESLNLSGCYSLTDMGFSVAVSEPLLTLTSLNLSLCKQITDNSLHKLSQTLINLESLDLGGCTSITNTGIWYLTNNLTKIRQLDLRSCRNIGDVSLRHISDSWIKLESLNLQDCQKITNLALDFASHTRIHSLNLSFCSGITDAGLKFLARMTCLRDLKLRSCDQVSDLGIAFLADGGSGITKLDVSFCDKIGDQALIHVSQGLCNLRSISLNACPVSDTGIEKLVTCLRDLDTLNIGQCSKLTDQSLKLIAQFLTNLKCIDLYGCPKISPVGIEQIVRLPHLSVLNLGLWLRDGRNC